MWYLSKSPRGFVLLAFSVFGFLSRSMISCCNICCVISVGFVVTIIGAECPEVTLATLAVKFGFISSKAGPKCSALGVSPKTQNRSIVF